MAKPSSARPSSRGSNDSRATTRATRATRSQSREPADTATDQQSGRNNAQTNAAGPPKKRPGRKPKNAAPELPTVNEDTTSEDQLRAQLQAEIAADDAAAADEAEAIRPTSAHSVVSATTAKTTFSQEEIAELDPDVMVDILPNVYTAAEDLARLLVPVDTTARTVVRNEIRTQGTKYHKLYNNRINALYVYKGSFGSTEYTQPSIVLRALLKVQNTRDVPQGPWRPDSLIYKINMAQMLNCVLVVLDDNIETTEDGRDAIRNLSEQFSGSIAGPTFDPNALELCLALLTQVAIIHIAESMSVSGFAPKDHVMDIFYEQDQNGDLVFRHRNVLHMLNLPQEEQAAQLEGIRQYVSNLRQCFDDHSSTEAAFEALRAAFPWESFVDRVIQYYLERKLELDQQISSAGGLAEIMGGLAAEVERRINAREAESKRESFARATPKQGFGKAGIKAIKARAKKHAANAPSAMEVVFPTPAPTKGAPVAPMPGSNVTHVHHATVPGDDDDYVPIENIDNAVQPTQAQSTARSTLNVLDAVHAEQRQAAARNRPRNFNERQDGATRVSFDDSQQVPRNRAPSQFEYPPPATTGQQGPYHESPRRTGSKRPRQDDDDDDDFEPTQDQGFEVDARDTGAADQRRKTAPQPRPAQPRPSSAANTAVSGPSTAPQARIVQSAAISSPSRNQRRNPGSSIPAAPVPYDSDDNEEIPPSQRFKRAKVAARQNTVVSRTQKPVQERKQWTDEEDDAIIDLVAEHCNGGIQYSKLKRIDSDRAVPLLSRRSAEDMRFKLRNMKETFLKGHRNLPTNFEYVVLDKKAREKLASMNIEYHQDPIRGGYVRENDE